jgi:predicted acylesterase/phospholipase RssA
MRARIGIALRVAILFSVSLLTLPGCASTAIRVPTAAQGKAPNSIRTLGADQQFSTVSSQSVARGLLAQRAGQPVKVLALSGGGADGAFGAGALVGLTQSALRPQFSVVTGVSTGALIATYAFLGSGWDDQLTEVYTSGGAEHLLRSRGLRRGAALRQLVDHYVTDALIQAVAHEASTGRLLLVATTDVSTGQPVVWDLGSIAMNGGPAARELFRDVLVASASVPGLFPPVVIRVREQQVLSEEVHVDGAIAVPLFVPLGFAEPSHGADVYVIVNGRLSEQRAAIRFEVAQFEFAAIPLAYPQHGSFDFGTPAMRSLFQYGYQCAQAGRLWTPSRSVGRDGDNRDDNGAGRPTRCPADDAQLISASSVWR